MPFKKHGPGGCCCHVCTFDWKRAGSFLGTPSNWIIDWKDESAQKIRGISSAKLATPGGVGIMETATSFGGVMFAGYRWTSTVTLNGPITWGFMTYGTSAIDAQYRHMYLFRLDSDGCRFQVIEWAYKAASPPFGAGVNRMKLYSEQTIAGIASGVEFDIEVQVSIPTRTINNQPEYPWGQLGQHVRILIDDVEVALVHGGAALQNREHYLAEIVAGPASWPDDSVNNLDYLILVDTATGADITWGANRNDREEWLTYTPPSGIGGRFSMTDFRGFGLDTQYTEDVLDLDGCEPPQFKYDPLGTSWLDETTNTYTATISGSSIVQLNQTMEAVRLSGVYPEPEAFAMMAPGQVVPSYTGSANIGGEVIELSITGMTIGTQLDGFWLSATAVMRAQFDPPVVPPAYAWEASVTFHLGKQIDSNQTLPVSWGLGDFDFAVMRQGSTIAGSPPHFTLVELIGSGFTLSLAQA